MLLKMFNEKWDNCLRIVQKNLDYTLESHQTRIITGPKFNVSYINCMDYSNKSIKDYDMEIVTEDFIKQFNKMCNFIIGKDLNLFFFTTHWEDVFCSIINEEYGSGVSALFWIYYSYKHHNKCCAGEIRHIIVEDIDRFFHPVSLIRIMTLDDSIKNFKIILLMCSNCFSTFNDKVIYIQSQEGNISKLKTSHRRNK